MFAWLQRLSRRCLGVGRGETESPDAAVADSPKGALGRRGEALAARCLRRQGMRILARNLVIGRYEIDIVAGDADTVVFVEVKTRSSVTFAPPEWAVTAAKRRRLRAAARQYLRRWGPAESRSGAVPIRFDVVAIAWPPDGGKPATRHIRGAFDERLSGNDRAWRRRVGKEKR